MEPMITVSGLRGVLGSELNPQHVTRYVAAFVATTGATKVVVTRDGRGSGEMLAQIVQGTLRALGCEVLDGGVAATPTMGRLVREHSAGGGVQISASHNPPEYNGLKLFLGEGRVVPAQVGEQILARYRDASFIPEWCGHDEIGELDTVRDPLGDHLRAVLSIVDVRRIQAKGYRVLLDANAGSGSRLGVPLLEALGCHVTLLGGTPDGKFLHPPEPTLEHLRDVGENVRVARADVGFCQDPDADRLALIDANGSYVGEEYTLALCVAHRLRQGAKGAIVTNCSTSRMSAVVAEAFGAPFFRSRVGEAHVADLMIREQAIFGGEGNGGPIDPRVGYIRDSFVGIALILESMATSSRSLRELVAELPQFHMAKGKGTIPPERVPELFQRLRDAFPDARTDMLDGLRLDWSDRWLLVRGSNTEPIVRLMAEAPTRIRADDLVRSANDILMSVMGRAS